MTRFDSKLAASETDPKRSMGIDAGYPSKISWSETKTLSLESRLPDVMTTFERWAFVHAERLEVERREAIEKQKRRDREDELAPQAYVEHALGEQLVTDLNAWELVGQLRLYLAAMAERIGHIADADERSAAVEWLEWCERYAAERDPFTRPIWQPKISPPGYSELQGSRNRRGCGSDSGDRRVAAIRSAMGHGVTYGVDLAVR